MSNFSASNNLTAICKEMLENQINMQMLNMATKLKYFNDRPFSFKLLKEYSFSTSSYSKQGTYIQQI